MSEQNKNSSILPLTRWPSVKEVRENYLIPGIGWAYALVRGFNDYHSVVVKFYISSGLVGEDEEVFVDFPDGPSVTPIGILDQQDGFSVEFLCLANKEMNNNDIRMEVELSPWSTPNYVCRQSPEKLKQQGFHVHEGFKWELKDVPELILSKQCDRFREEIFRKAGKTDPMKK